jgi:UDP-2-acetamido-2-deoxy-ribo-hexuluronate aminotransferase
MKIPMLDLKREYEYMKEDIDAAIRRCLDHQQWILGPEVKEFEDKVAEYLGVKHCIGVSSGSDALVLPLRALAIKTKGQEYFDRSDLIITTPFTFTATGDAILRAGATPAFVDIDPATYNIDPAKIREFLAQHTTHNTQHTRVVGILPVHLYGQSCHMAEIMSIADEYGLFIVEDVAQAFGGSWQGKKLGAVGTAGSFSFFPSKNLGGFGDGGMVSTNDDDLNTLIRMLIKHGGKDKYNVDHIGYNARMDTLQAAILLAKIPYIAEFNSRRRHIAALYAEGLKDAEGLVLPSTSQRPTATSAEHVYHQFTLRILNGKRDALQQRLRESGIDSVVYYPTPLHKMNAFAGMCTVSGELSRAEEAAQSVLSLPIEPLYNEEHILYIVQHFLPSQREGRQCPAAPMA